MKTQKSLNYITLLIASGIVVNFGLFVINVNAYFSITAKTFQGKALVVRDVRYVSPFYIFVSTVFRRYWFNWFSIDSFQTMIIC